MMHKATRAQPPVDLTATSTLLDRLHPATRDWLESVTGEYMLEEHHSRILLLAAAAWDRANEAHERLAAEGLTVEGREGMKTHPCIRIEREASEAFARFIKQLGLDEVGQPHRGPGRPAAGVGITHWQLEGREAPRKGRRSKRITPILGNGT
jgi:Phage terminase, small subunit